MYDINSFFERLDWFYENHRLDHAENFMREQLKTAGEEGDYGAQLSIINELMGFLRTQGRHQENLAQIEEALALAGRLGLEGTLPYATTLLNAATGCRAAGELLKACEYYEKTIGIYEKQLGPDDYRLASLYNNMSILKSDLKDGPGALECLKKALAIVERQPGSRVEEAVTYTNLGLLYMNLGETKQADEASRKALAIFEDGYTEDPHYASALAARGEIEVKRGNLDAAEEAYKKALAQIKKCYGENESYRITAANLKKVQEKRNETCG